MVQCVCGNMNPEFFEELGHDIESKEPVRARGIRCQNCKRTTYILRDIHVDFDRRAADEHLVESWNKTMLKEILKIMNNTQRELNGSE